MFSFSFLCSAIPDLDLEVLKIVFAIFKYLPVLAMYKKVLS